ncbi:hypothetical protein ACIRPT_30870 [Streptomyces sp. NPDC101227]|uniref:hypothetical protein n=1 Tax=Streptomyces sp. NPDC101227 TaxID=3366136 RepID=UPI00381CDE0D
MRCLPPLRPARPRTAAALGAAAFVLAAPAAFAGDFGEVQASPQPARAGSSVSLTTRDCGHSRSATVDAGTLGGGIVTLRPGGDGGALVGSLKVRPDTRPGNYALGGSCADGRDLTGVVSAGTAPADRGGARGPMPRGGVQTGAGADAGAAGEAAGTTEVLAGTGLMLAIAAGGSWVLRRRHAGRRD